MLQSNKEYKKCICSGKCPSGKCLSGMCLVGEVSVGEMSVGDMSGPGSVHRGNVRRRCVWSGKCPSGKCPDTVYQSLWFLFGEGLISPNQLTLIGVSISNYSYLSSSYKNEIVISSIFQKT